ncbi:hypothetical protein ABEF95_003249 [Exophiala dermatitidis]
MTRENELYINEAEGVYNCLACDRFFSNANGALSHCRNAAVHSGEWCNRCQWLFVSREACGAHKANSRHHNVCHRCHLDYPTASNLEEHKVEDHHECTVCGEEFINDNNLRQHKRAHLLREIECFGCYEMFSEFPAMALHLESGYCTSGVDLDKIDNAVFDDAHCAEYVNDWMDEYRFRCPNCEKDFRFVSGLLQHVDSRACNPPVGYIMQDFWICIGNCVKFM